MFLIHLVGSKPKRIHVDINNDPMIKGNYKVVVRHDVPEDSQDNDRKLLVDMTVSNSIMEILIYINMVRSRYFLLMASLSTELCYLKSIW